MDVGDVSPSSISGNTTDPLNETYTLDTNTTSPQPNNMSSAPVPEGCIVLQFEDFIPWDNPDNIVTADFEALVEEIKSAYILPALFLIGGPTNIVNLVVFCKQGLKDRINLCLFALSLADGLYLLQLMFFNGDWIAYHERYGSMFEFIVNHNLVGFFGFTWTSEVITAIIASERCFCILSPLHSQTILKTSTMAVILLFSFIITLGGKFIDATRYRLICAFDPVTRTTSKIVAGSQFYYENRELVDKLDSLVYGVIIPGVTCTIVLVTTIITAIKLRQAVQRRSEMSASKISPKEIALTRMLISVSILFIVCVVPILGFRFSLFFVPEMNVGRRYHNLFVSFLWLLEIGTYINASFNFFIYYNMGSKYRETCKELFNTMKQLFNRRACKNTEFTDAGSSAAGRHAAK